MRMFIRMGLVCTGVFLLTGSLFAQDSPAPAVGNAAATSAQLVVNRAASAAFDSPFAPDPSQEIAQAQTKPPAGTSSSPPSLGDLGFSPSQTQPNPQEQARLDKRSHMLKMHQRMGLITAIPLLATVITGGFAGGRNPSATATMRDVHAGLGSLSGALYFTTAYFAIFAPRIQGTHTRGPIRLHKALAWIHGPGMVLTPILGIMAFDQLNKGEKVHGIAKAHGAVGVVTAAAFGLAIASVSFRF